MIERVQGVLTERPPENDFVMRIDKGDVILLHREYLTVDGFFRNARGNLCMRLGIPKERARLRAWALRNPHCVKSLDLVTRLEGG